MKKVYNDFLAVNSTDIVPLDLIDSILTSSSLSSSIYSVINNKNLTNSEKISILKDFEFNFYKDLQNLKIPSTLKIYDIKETDFSQQASNSTVSFFGYFLKKDFDSITKRYNDNQIILNSANTIHIGNTKFSKLSNALIYSYNSKNYKKGISCFLGIERKYVAFYLFKSLIDVYNNGGYDNSYFINNNIIKLYTNSEFKSENKLFIRKFNEYFISFNLKEENLSKEYFDNIFIHDKSINFKDYFKDLNDLTECVVDDFLNGINVEAMFIN